MFCFVHFFFAEKKKIANVYYGSVIIVKCLLESSSSVMCILFYSFIVNVKNKLNPNALSYIIVKFTGSSINNFLHVGW